MSVGMSTLRTGLGGLQRRVRLLVPRPIRRADLAVFRALARTDIPVIGPILPRLSRAANHSRLWMAVAALLALSSGRSRRAGVRGLLAVAATSALTNLPAKLLAGRARPDLAVVPQVRRLARVPTSTSFPSGHAASAFAFATAASLEESSLRVPLFTLAAAVAASRVYTGVHYPGDVLAGSAIGAAVAHATTRSWPLPPRAPATAETAEAPVRLPESDGTGVVLVANVGAGRALAPRRAEELRRALPGVRVLEAEPGEELSATLRRAASQARVLGVAGGDGTVSAAAAVAQDVGIPLLIVPAGTLNHLARDLGLEEIDAMARAVRDGRVIGMDLGEFDGVTFVNAAIVGAYPQVVASRERLEGRVGKWPAALWGTLQSLMRGEPTDLEIDGRRRRVWQLFVGNGRYATAGIAPTRRERLDDGLLDVRLVHAERPWARTRAALSMSTGRLRRCATYERWTATELHIRSRQGSLLVARDGEIRRTPDEFVVRKRPRALVLLQPQLDGSPDEGDTTPGA